MDAARFQRPAGLFEEARLLPPADRGALVEPVGEEDPALSEQLEAVLAEGGSGAW